ncbi:MAG: ROK family protein, partial [Gemmatimonadota bacterium]
HGCLEAYTSDAATVARYLERAGPGRRRHEVSIGDVVRLAGEGDECGEQAVMATARYLGMGVAAVINVLNPEVVIVGGEIARVWRLVEPSIREQVSARTLTAAAAATPIVPELSHGQQRLRGATALIMAPIFAAPQLA